MQITMNINFSQKNERQATDPYAKVDQMMPIGMTRSQMNQLHLMVNQQSSQPQVEINVTTGNNKKNAAFK